MSTMDTTNTNENEMIKVSDDEAINASLMRNFRISFQLRTARRTLSRTQSL